MRMRSRFRGKHVRRPKMKGDWLMLANANCRVTGALPELCNAMTADAVSLVALISPADLVAKEDSLTIVRIVGNIDWTMAAKFHVVAGLTSTVVHYTLWEGIYVATANMSSGSVTLLDPRSSVDLESDMWMWLRCRRFSFVLTGPGADSVWEAVSWSDRADNHVDIRVSRKLKAGQELIYANAITQDVTNSGSVAGLIPTTDFAFIPQLRGYVKF